MGSQVAYEKLVRAAAELALQQLLPEVAPGPNQSVSRGAPVAVVAMGQSQVLRSIAATVRDGAESMMTELYAKQAQIDALMMEFCPGEMAEGQKENWGCRDRQANGARTEASGAPAFVRLTGQQVMDALAFVAPDCFHVINRDSEVASARESFQEQMACEITIGTFPETRSDDGELLQAGVYAWLAEQPQVGRVALGPGPQVPKADTA
jgi:hypothetical protein